MLSPGSEPLPLRILLVEDNKVRIVEAIRVIKLSRIILVIWVIRLIEVIGISRYLELWVWFV
jgi:hypothetical protein